MVNKPLEVTHCSSIRNPTRREFYYEQMAFGHFQDLWTFDITFPYNMTKIDLQVDNQSSMPRNITDLTPCNSHSTAQLYTRHTEWPPSHSVQPEHYLHTIFQSGRSYSLKRQIVTFYLIIVQGWVSHFFHSIKTQDTIQELFMPQTNDWFLPYTMMKHKMCC